MATTPKVLLKRSSVAGRIPSAGDLSYGELAINFADGKIYYKNSSNAINAFVDSARVQAIADAVEVVAESQLDSAEVTSLVDSAYVQARVPLSYLESLIDSAYVQARQIYYTGFDSDFDARLAIKTTDDLTEGSNLYYTKARVDSDIATSLNDSGNVVNVTINNTILDTVDSAYVNARVNAANYLDSAEAIRLIDSAYVQARQITYDFLDSVETVAIIDSHVNTAFVDALNVDADKLDGQHGNYYRDWNNVTNKPTILDLVDVSTQITADVDKAFVDALNVDADTVDGYHAQAFFDAIDSAVDALVDGAPGALDTLNELAQALNDDSNAYNNLLSLIAAKLDSAEAIALIDSAHVQARQDYAYSSLTGVPTNVSTFINDANYLDSNTVVPIIDSAYVQARQLNFDNLLDSVEVTALVDSAYVQARQITYNTSNFTDSAFVTGLPVSTFTNDANYLDSTTVADVIDSAYVRARVRTDQDLRTTDSVTFSGLTVSGDLNVTGNTYSVQSVAYTISDPLIHLADSNEFSDVVDIGFIGHYYRNAQRRHAGVFRDASDEQFYIFNNMVDSAFDSTSPPNTINRSSTDFQLATLNVGNIYGQYQGFDSDFNTKSTSDLTEGTNLYYTKARADSDIAASLNDSGNTVNITINNTITDTVDSAYVLARVAEAPFLDSADAIQLIDSAYVQARQAGGLDSANVSSIIIADVDQTFVNALNVDADNLDGQTGTFYLDYNNFTNTPTIPTLGNDFVDSGQVNLIVDSAYVQARQTVGGTVDSADIIAIVDSAYVQARQSSVGSGGTDSATVSAIIVNDVDSAYIQARQLNEVAAELTQTTYNFTADSGQSSFTGLDVDSGKFQVYLNGLLLPQVDYTHNSSKVDLLVAADSGDVLEVIKFSGNDTGAIAIQQRHYIYTATSGQTVFTGADDNSATLSYTQNRINVYLNGLLLLDSADYTQNGAGTTVTFTSGVTAGHIVNIQTLSGNTGTFAPLAQTFYEFTADSGQTIFTGADDNAETLDFSDDKVAVYLNGILLAGDDYTLSAGNRVTLTSAADSGNLLTISKLSGNNIGIDSGEVRDLIDSAYIQARQSSVGSGGIDSAAVTSLIDSAYINARVNPFDSSHVLALVDSAYIQLRDRFQDSAGVIQLVDSALVQLKAIGLDYDVLSNKPTTLANIVEDTTPQLGGPLDGNGNDIFLDDDDLFAWGGSPGRTNIQGKASTSYSSNYVKVNVRSGASQSSEIARFTQDDGVYTTIGLNLPNWNTALNDYYDLKIKGPTSNTLVANETIRFPDSSGTVALTKDLLDSTDIINLVDSAYIQARQTTGGGGTVDSAYVLSVVDSAAVPFSQTFYHFTADSGQITFSGFDDDSDTLTYTNGALAVYLNGILLVDSVDYTASNGTSIILADSAAAGDVLSVLKFGGNTTGIDSANVINLIDSAYINARVNPFDSSHVLALVDSAYIQLRDRFQDSSGILAIVDSAYVQARQTNVFNNIYVSGQDLVVADSQSSYLSFEAGAGITLQTDANTDTITITNALNAEVAQGIIDSAYVQARQSLIDSALVTQLIDSAYVTARAPAGGGGGGSGTVDSAQTIALIEATVDSDYIGTKVDFTRGEFVNEKSQYTATASQTVFNHSSIDPTHLDVYLNGILQVVNDDYTANTSAVTFTTGVDSGYSVTIVEKRGRILTQRGLVESKYYFTTPTPTISITGADDNSNTLDYSDGFLDVYLNGILLKDSDDYSTNAGTTVTLVSATDSNDLVTLINRKGVVVTPNVKNYEFTASAGQTTFSGSDINSNTLAYVPGAAQVFLNGILLRNVDYTGITGTSIILADSASLNDELVVSAFSNPGQNMDLYKFTADSGQTIFSGNDLSNASLAYQPGNIQVFMNGLLLNDSDDYTASNGMSVVLTSGADLSDEIKIASFVSNADVIRTNAWTAPTGTPVTATAGDKLFIDTSSAKTVTLPSSASMGDEIRIIDVTGNASTNNITVSRNGHNIQGAASDLTINVDRAGIGLVYYNSAQGWVLIEN